MFLSAFDPSLLIYEQDDWNRRSHHCQIRLEALATHRKLMKQHDQRIVMTHAMAAILYGTFPLNPQYKNVAELHDIRRFIWEDLQRAHYISPESPEPVDLSPAGLTCRHLEFPEVEAIWKLLLLGCVEESQRTNFSAQIISWNIDDEVERPTDMVLTILRDTGEEQHLFPLISDELSWATQLAPLDAWPNLRKCIELCFLLDLGMRSFQRVRRTPYDFDWTESFWKSIEDCQPAVRPLVIKAMTKKIYGIQDKGLGDEPFKGIRRFRVTGFWRVHYRELGKRLVFEEFGPHDIGM